MINNINLIKPLLNFENEGDFYMLYIFKRKKDQTTDKANHQSVRTIKTYCIESIDHLDRRWDEIVQMCEMFKARAYIHVQKQNHKDVAMNMITEIVTRIQSGQINQKNVFDSVVGQIKTNEKRWIVDIDVKDFDYVSELADYIDSLRPEGDKIEAVIPTKSDDPKDVFWIGKLTLTLTINGETYSLTRDWEEEYNYDTNHPCYNDDYYYESEVCHSYKTAKELLKNL